MTRTLNNAFAAALVAASAFGASPALAGGNYYVGGSPDAVKSQNVDTVRTHSIGNRHVVYKDVSADSQPTDRGDYRTMAPANAN